MSAFVRGRVGVRSGIEHISPVHERGPNALGTKIKAIVHHPQILPDLDDSAI
jgi:hypothetical protein